MAVETGTYYTVTCSVGRTPYTTVGGPVLFTTRDDLFTTRDEAMETVRAEWADYDPSDPYGPHGWGIDPDGDTVCDWCLRRNRCRNTGHRWICAALSGTVRCRRCDHHACAATVTDPITPTDRESA